MPITYEKQFSKEGKFQGKIPTITLKLNDEQQLLVIGTDFKQNGGLREIQTGPGMRGISCGKVNSFEKEFQAMVKQSLAVYGWNFELWPNPEGVIIEKL